MLSLPDQFTGISNSDIIHSEICSEKVANGETGQQGQKARDVSDGSKLAATPSHCEIRSYFKIVQSLAAALLI
jgi:hypothetical protein